MFWGILTIQEPLNPDLMGADVHYKIWPKTCLYRNTGKDDWQKIEMPFCAIAYGAIQCDIVQIFSSSERLNLPFSASSSHFSENSTPSRKSFFSWSLSLEGRGMLVA